MAKQSVIVHCTYAETEKSVKEIVEESFRAYLRRILAPECGGAV